LRTTSERERQGREHGGLSEPDFLSLNPGFPLTNGMTVNMVV
jgi:hypothetical protein